MAELDKKTIGITSLITLGIVLAGLVVPGFFDTPKYYCEAESSIKDCPGGLSGGSVTRCYLNEEKTSWDYCKTGWVQVTDDRPIQEDSNSPPIIEIIEVHKTTIGQKRWLCSIESCEAIK